MVELCTSPSATSANAPAVSNIRSLFETPSSGGGTPSRDRRLGSSSSAHAYVEGEESVIALMKNKSSVKSRMAQFSGQTTNDDQMTVGGSVL